MFTPTAEKLVPDLTPREELVVLARKQVDAGGEILANLWILVSKVVLAQHFVQQRGQGRLLRKRS